MRQCLFYKVDIYTVLLIGGRIADLAGSRNNIQVVKVWYKPYKMRGAGMYHIIPVQAFHLFHIDHLKFYGIAVQHIFMWPVYSHKLPGMCW